MVLEEESEAFLLKGSYVCSAAQQNFQTLMVITKVQSQTAPNVQMPRNIPVLGGRITQ